MTYRATLPIPDKFDGGRPTRTASGEELDAPDGTAAHEQERRRRVSHFEGCYYRLARVSPAVLRDAGRARQPGRGEGKAAQQEGTPRVPDPHAAVEQEGAEPELQPAVGGAHFRVRVGPYERLRCKEYFRARKSVEGLSLSSKTEQQSDELRLTLSITSYQSFNLPFAYHIHGFNTFQGSLRCVKALEAL